MFQQNGAGDGRAQPIELRQPRPPHPEKVQLIAILLYNAPAPPTRAPAAVQKMLALTFPNFDPVAFQFGPLVVRWYALAYIVGLTELGLERRPTLGIPGGERRLNRILALIQSCRYSIHDLSRIEVDRTHLRLLASTCLANWA